MFEIKKKPNGDYYWHLKAPNGQVIAESYHTYASKAAVYNSIASVQNIAEHAEIKDLS